MEGETRKSSKGKQGEVTMKSRGRKWRKEADEDEEEDSEDRAGLSNKKRKIGEKVSNNGMD